MTDLVPMTPAEFEPFFERLVVEYAADKVRSGNWTSEESVRRSREDCQALLPKGTATPGQHLYRILDTETGEKVGIVWLAEDGRKSPPIGFIYDLEVEAPYRRRGYATQAMLALEVKARELGLATISLHVFGFNHEARALYAKLGYEITNINMSKSLKAPGA
jgi:RimJ/RimL family protein N-acetyltransferase